MDPTARSAAALAVAAVLSGRSLDDVLPEHDASLAPGDRGLLRALTYGVLREHGFLAAIVGKMLKSPLNDEPRVAALVEVGLFQLRSMRVSPHAAVSETVEACEAIGAPQRRALVNALLRRFQRERRALELAAASDAARRWSHPTWLIDTLRCDWPEQWERVLNGGNEQGPLTLRVNRRRTTRTDYAASLRAAGLSYREVANVPDALVLDAAVGVDRLPGFAQGEVSIQDAAAQLAVELLDLAPGQRVLDACCAPGGKTAHALERADVEVLAVDQDAQRMERVQENLTRLGLSADLLAWDAGRLQDRWSGAPFDRILLDAPCSGTGVIRRHPDIKWLRRHDDVPRMAAEQLRLLESLWPLLAPGGRLVYATCSILAAEGEDVVRRFFTTRADAKHEPIEAPWGEARRFGRRLAPGGDFDGFYYACLRKSTKAA
ncbi:MAG: rsmB [Panacagrimonas sp.]|jgi:16S rRNA (cytosine967-C5)-methyltransferase|nr:16S rRNA (cytosine(967)-C(5))-methyltransferase RsmB [Panacagrimonas sp.]MCC2659045.1 rsmB [Panacagrimonas sp.]